MKHLQSSRHTRHRTRLFFRFLRKNRAFLLYTVWMLIGALAGCILYSQLSSEQQTCISDIASLATQPHDFPSACIAVLSSAFSLWLILVVLFLLGLTAYGAPLILPVLLFFGIWIGSSACYTLQHEGYLSTYTVVILPMTIAAVAVLIATDRSLRMSCLFSRQLLPLGAHCGSLWQDFKRYVVQYLLCLVIVLAAAVFKVGIRILL